MSDSNSAKVIEVWDNLPECFYNFDDFTINLYMDEQDEWLAHFQEMPNISAFGDTPQEALESLKIAWELTKEYYLAQGISIPIPPKRDKTLINTPK